MTKRLIAVPGHRVLLVVAVAALALATCSPLVGTRGPEGQQVTERQTGPAHEADPASRPVEGAGGDAEPLEPPRLRSTSEAADDEVTVEPESRGHEPFDPVGAQRPQLRVEEAEAGAGDLVAEIMELEAVSFATAVRLGDVAIVSPEKGITRVTAAAIEPRGFRVLTPQVTADAVEVWERISEGDAAFTHDVGYRLDLELGSRIPAGDGETLRVGAFASNGVPPVADVIFTHDTAEEIGFSGDRVVLVALRPETDSGVVADEIAEVAETEPEEIETPAPERAFLSGAESRGAFEPFTYVSLGDGMLQMDRGWIGRNISRARVPVFRGEVLCHRKLIPQLRGALQEVVEAGLAHLIDPSDYGGCWVPRHIDFNPSKPLSMHAWGLAVDFNVSTNQLGQRPQMDPRIVEIFERWGFVWGGRWSRPDGMHFELGALLQDGG